ncbi:hypothetical protein BH09VER1_BH09VER1_18770 [soil metagenome]
MSQDQEMENRKAAARHIREAVTLYPDERAVALVSRFFGQTRPNLERRALDLGCGGGRHIKLLLDYGFQTYGLDYIKEACDTTRQIFDGHARLKEIRQADLREHGFPPRYFDLILGWGIVFLRPYDDIIADLRILRSLLTPGGVIGLTFRTKANWFFGRGRQLGPQTYHLNDEAGPYRDMVFTFLDQPDVEQVLDAAGFSLVSWEKVELLKNNGRELNSWIIAAVQSKSGI